MSGPDPSHPLPGPLVALGWDPAWAETFATAVREVGVAAGSVEPARVVRQDRGEAAVVTASGPRRAGLAPGTPASAQPATGDWVVLRGDADRALRDGAVVVAVLPRRSAFVRGEPGREGGAQVVAANIDTVFLVHSLGVPVNLRRVERELVLGWESGASPVVVLNKADLAAEPEAARAEVESVAPGVPVHVVSAATGAGVEALAGHATGARTVALVGASGVGKSTLVNRLVGDEVQATADVRVGDQRGRHTTTARELLALPGGGLLVDTPGLRAVGLHDTDEGLARVFADIEAAAARCRFRDCAHDREPGCAVRGAIDDGTLTEARLASYRRLVAEADRVDRHRRDMRR